MDKELIDKMKGKNRLILEPFEALFYYSVPIIILFITLISLTGIDVIPNKSAQSAQDFIDNYGYYILGFVSALLIYAWQRNQLKFREIYVEYSAEQFNRALDRTVRHLNWKVHRNNRHYLQAIHPGDISGHLITILKDKNKLYCNAILNPEEPFQIISLGWNKRAIDVFLENLVDVKEGIPFRLAEDNAPMTWGKNHFIIRLIGYPAAIGLVAFSIYLTTSEHELISDLIAIIPMALGITFFILDFFSRAKNKR